MPTITDERRALNRWARNQGWNDFDTFVRTGGSIAEAREDIDHRIAMLETARTALARYSGKDQTQDERKQDGTPPTIGPDALARLEAEQLGEPPDPDNAQIQGFDHAGD